MLIQLYNNSLIKELSIWFCIFLHRNKSIKSLSIESQSDGGDLSSGNQDCNSSTNGGTSSFGSPVSGNTSQNYNDDKDDSMTNPVEYDSVLIMSLGNGGPPEYPGMMSEDKVISAIHVSW